MARPTVLVALFLVAICLAATFSDAASVQFVASTSELLNPGRGWYSQADMDVPGGDPLSLDDLVDLRDGAPRQSLLLRNYWLVGNSSLKFNQGAPLPQEFLTTMSNDLEAIREAGMKALLRFGYTHTDPTVEGFVPPYGDASLSVASAHITQLSPIFKANADVIFTIQAGFIGTWGEWYYTDYYGGVGNSSGNAERKTLLDRLLAATSPSTPIAVRTPYYKYQLLNRKTTLSTSEAYSGSNVARLGFHNDCFLSSADDLGTYVDPGFEYPYLGNETKYTTMGGETCAKDTRSSCYAKDGGAALTELARFHWKYLNIGYNELVINTWKSEGCFSNITQRLGYRLLLSPSATHTYTSAVRPGRRFDVSLVIENEGFSAPLHQVTVYLVLTAESTVWTKLPVDPRFWHPEQSPFTLKYSLGIGPNVPAGNYSLGLLFADALMASSPSAEPLPYYAIQLANEGTWNADTGINDLGVTVQVATSAPDTGAYAGDLWVGARPSSLDSAGGTTLPSVAGALLLLVLLPFLLF